MTLFDTVEAEYSLYPPGPPEAAVHALAATVDGVPSAALLDLGAGTGQVTAALLPYIAHADLVDANEGMLLQAAASLRHRLGRSLIALHPVQAEKFTAPYLGYQAHLITCCRSFHRMDRPAVLAMADRVAAPGATVAVMGDGSLWTQQAEWTSALKELIQSHLGRETRAGLWTRRAEWASVLKELIQSHLGRETRAGLWTRRAEWASVLKELVRAHRAGERRPGATGTNREPARRYQDDLAASAFSDVTEHRFPLTHTWTPQAVVGYLRSTSYAHPDLFTDHARFEKQARQLLAEHARNGVLLEETVFTLLLARRPRDVR